MKSIELLEKIAQKQEKSKKIKLFERGLKRSNFKELVKISLNTDKYTLHNLEPIFVNHTICMTGVFISIINGETEIPLATFFKMCNDLSLKWYKRVLNKDLELGLTRTEIERCLKKSKK